MSTIRNLDPATANKARQLWNACMPDDYLLEQLFEEKVYLDDAVDDELRVIAIMRDEIAGFAIGSVRSTAPDAGCIKMFAVAPEFRRAGIGSALIAHLEVTLASRGLRKVRIGESIPNYLQPGIDARWAGTIRFAEFCGFVSFSDTKNLSVDLRSTDLDTKLLEATQRANGFRIRRATQEDRNGVMELIDAEFPAWAGEVHAAFGNEPITLHLAEQSARVVAFSASETNNTGLAWFGPMGTSHHARGQRLGEVLLKRCLSDLRERGFDVATIPWVGPVEFYRKTVGAVVSRSFLRMEKPIA